MYGMIPVSREWARLAVWELTEREASDSGDGSAREGVYVPKEASGLHFGSKCVDIDAWESDVDAQPGEGDQAEEYGEFFGQLSFEEVLPVEFSFVGVEAGDLIDGGEAAGFLGRRGVRFGFFLGVACCIFRLGEESS